MDDNEIKDNGNNNFLHSIKNNTVSIDKVIETSEFAGELPDWDLLPPAVVIKRVKRSI